MVAQYRLHVLSGARLPTGKAPLDGRASILTRKVSDSVRKKTLCFLSGCLPRGPQWLLPSKERFFVCVLGVFCLHIYLCTCVCLVPMVARRGGQIPLK